MYEFKHDFSNKYKLTFIGLVTSKGARLSVSEKSQANLESDSAEAQWVRL